MNERISDNKKHVYRTYHSHDSNDDDDDCDDYDDGKKDTPLLSTMDAIQDGEICMCVHIKTNSENSKAKSRTGEICSCFFRCFHTREKKNSRQQRFICKSQN